MLPPFMPRVAAAGCHVCAARAADSAMLSIFHDASRVLLLMPWFDAVQAARGSAPCAPERRCGPYFFLHFFLPSPAIYAASMPLNISLIF